MNTKKYYWLFAGAFVGVFTVLTAYWNMTILVGSGDLTISGSLIVIAEYTVLIYGLSIVEKSVKAKTKKK